MDQERRSQRSDGASKLRPTVTLTDRRKEDYFYEEALKTNHQGHSWKLSQMANDALTEDTKKIIRLAGSEGKA